MPAELRKLVFSQEEVWEAVVIYCHKMKMKMPSAPLENVKISDHADNAVSMIFGATPPNKPVIINLSSQELGAAILLRCVKEGIPLPRRSARMILPGDNTVVFLICVNGLQFQPVTSLCHNSKCPIKECEIRQPGKTHSLG